MPRYIDADALKKDLTRFYHGEVAARELIDEQPTFSLLSMASGFLRAIICGFVRTAKKI